MVAFANNPRQSFTRDPFERQSHAFHRAAGGATEPPRAERRESIPLLDPFWFMRLLVVQAAIGSIWGLSTLLLAGLGLSGVEPKYLLAVAAIVLGLAFLMLGAVDTAWAHMFRFAEHETSPGRIVLSSGVTAVSIAGLAAVVLGVLSIVFLGDSRLVAVAVILLGLGLFLHSGVTWRVSHFTDKLIYHGWEGDRSSSPFAVNKLSLTPVRDFLVGLSGMILGILAMMDIAPGIFGIVALLAMGGALTLTASAICAASQTTLRTVCSKG